MGSWISALGVSLAVFSTVAPAGAAAEPGAEVSAATAHDGHLLCVYSGGRVAVWDLKSRGYAKDRAAALSRQGLTRVAADGDTLWAIDATTLYRWANKGGGWEKVAGYEADEQAVAIVPVGGVPYLVFPSRVLDPVGKRTFKAPEVDRPLGGPPLRILATHGTASMVWIGTGKGEWGGVLLGLDPKAGAWVQGDGLGYVTGITHVAGDEVVVSWAMSHFRAYTKVQIHKADGTVKTEHPMLESKYYQRVAYSPHDKVLYGVESKEVVTIADGKPSKVAALSMAVFEREPDAIGVAPGIRALIPIGSKAVAVVPTRGEPWLVRGEELISLRKP
jgi:hypothetical protein